MQETIRVPVSPTYSIFVPFTRYWAVNEFLGSLDAMTLPRSECEIIFYNDTNDAQLQKALRDWLHTNAQDFDGVTLYQSQRVPPNDFDVSLRRQRICDMKNISRGLLSDTTFVFCLEDDTIAPSHSFNRLLQHLASEEDVAVVSGVEVGRWALPVIGAWEIRPLDIPTIVRSVPYRQRGVQYVDGVGWYCYMTYTRLYKQAHYHYEADVLGPDVVYSWEQRKAGYKVLVDWSLPCEHLQEDGTRIIPDGAHTTTGIWHRDSANNWDIEDRPAVLQMRVVK